MKAKMKLGKIGSGISAFLACTFLVTSLAWASPISSNTVSLSTPYGTMSGYVSADVDNSLWSGSTSIASAAPVVYVSGQCQDSYTGTALSSNSQTSYNTTSASTWGDANNCRHIAVYGTHEVRGQNSYVKYNFVSQVY